jgi:hypothetical protein
VSECVGEALKMRRPWATRGCYAIRGEKMLFLVSYTITNFLVMYEFQSFSAFVSHYNDFSVSVVSSRARVYLQVPGW